MKRIVTVFLLFPVLYSISAQQITMKNIGDFTTVKVFDRISAELIPSDVSKVELYGNKSNDVDVINKDRELKIRMKTVKFMTGDDVKVKIYYNKKLSSIQASEGAVVSGTGKVDSESLFLNAKEGAEINVEAEVQKINARINSGAGVTVFGNAEEQDIVITSGGRYSAKETESKRIAVTVNGGGNAEVNASEKVDAKIRAGGVIDIYGNAEISQSTLAGGKIITH